MTNTKFSIKVVQDAPSPAAQLALQHAATRNLARIFPDWFPDGAPYQPRKIELPETLERSLVVATLEFANATNDYKRVRAVDIFAAWLPSPKLRPYTSQQFKKLSKPKLLSLKSLSERLGSDLAIILDKRLDIKHREISRITDASIKDSAGFALFPVHHFDDNRELHTDYQPVGGSLPAIINFCVLLLLSHDRRGYGAELKRCTWHRCMKFFLASRKGQGKGRARTKHCNNRCKDSHHNWLKSKARKRRGKTK